MSLNRATIIGYLGQDLELRNLSTNGQPVVTFAVATDESFTDKDGNRRERVDWHRVVVYGKLAETCHKYLSKGRQIQIYVEGRLRTREYEARDNGGKRYRTEIIAQRVQFLGSRPDLPPGRETEEPAASEDMELTRFRRRCWGEGKKEAFGWMKTIGGLRKTRYRGRERVQMHAYLVAAAYNLVRIARLAPACT